jgi:hypothetical protein
MKDFKAIRIHKSPTADTRTCDWSKVTKEELLAASKQHIRDVREAMGWFAGVLIDKRHDHDFTKITRIDEFHADFSTGFKTTGWWDDHRKVERHHLGHDDGVRDNVSLFDVLEYIADCVMAGKARSGTVTPLEIKPEVLLKAFENTWRALADNVEVVDD